MSDRECFISEDRDMNMTKAEWHKGYRKALVELAGMTEKQAFDYNKENLHFVDYGYSPSWYVREEMACLDNYSEFKVCHVFEGTVVRKETHAKKESKKTK